jgi:Uma2 family endonuclease
MTPEEFDRDEFDDFWSYELINGVLIVSPIPSEEETDPNEYLGYMLTSYEENHPEGHTLDATLLERYVKTGKNRRKPDRVIWAGLGRLPKQGETPTIIVEFVSSRKRDRERDYETKRKEYHKIKVKEYWIIDRFTQTMTVHSFEGGKPRKKIIQATESYQTKLLPGFTLPLARLFSRAGRWIANKGEEE